MAIWGGLAKQPDGRQVLQIYVDAADVKRLLDQGDERQYNSYTGDEMELDLPVKGATVAEVWLCVVPPDGPPEPT